MLWQALPTTSRVAAGSRVAWQRRRKRSTRTITATTMSKLFWRTPKPYGKPLAQLPQPHLVGLLPKYLPRLTPASLESAEAQRKGNTVSHRDHRAHRGEQEIDLTPTRHAHTRLVRGRRAAEERLKKRE